MVGVGEVDVKVDVEGRKEERKGRAGTDAIEAQNKETATGRFEEIGITRSGLDRGAGSLWGPQAPIRSGVASRSELWGVLVADDFRRLTPLGGGKVVLSRIARHYTAGSCGIVMAHAT